MQFELELVLKQEQEEYNREGIEWQKIDFFNNQIICDLVEAPHKGILAIMDDASKMTAEKVTDELLLETMDKQLKGHKHYVSRQLKPADKNMRHKVTKINIYIKCHVKLNGEICRLIHGVLNIIMGFEFLKNHRRSRWF